jgi:hypothetical protein
MAIFIAPSAVGTSLPKGVYRKRNPSRNGDFVRKYRGENYRGTLDTKGVYTLRENQIIRDLSAKSRYLLIET